MNIEITDKEIKLLNLMILSYWIENNNTHEDNYENWILTNELVKKLSQHDVIKSVCSCGKKSDEEYYPSCSLKCALCKHEET